MESNHRDENLVRRPQLGLAPARLARTALVLAMGRPCGPRYIGTLPVRIVSRPADIPPLHHDPLWHDMTHTSALLRWLREQLRDVARSLPDLKA